MSTVPFINWSQPTSSTPRFQVPSQPTRPTPTFQAPAQPPSSTGASRVTGGGGGVAPSGSAPSFQLPGSTPAFQMPGTAPATGTPTFTLPSGQTTAGTAPPPNLGNDMIPGQPGGGAPGQPPPWQPPGAPGTDAFGPTSAMDVYRASAPVMQREMNDRISESMARAGFTGNRFGSYAMKTAAEEGSRAGLDQNALMANLLYGQTNRDADRSLTANDQAMRWTQLEDEMARNRITLPFQMSQWEQGRQDMFSNQQFQDWSNNRMGWLPFLGSMAQSPGTAATPGQYGAQQTGGSPGFIDYASALAPYFMAYYGNRG